jgi:hypothetical protein
MNLKVPAGNKKLYKIIKQFRKTPEPIGMQNIKIIIKNQRPGLGYSSVVQPLPNMCEALGSIPAPKKKRQKEKKPKKT